jgi:hypothetical protein
VVKPKASFKKAEDTTAEDHRNTTTDWYSPVYGRRKRGGVSEAGEGTTQLPTGCSPKYNNYL